MIVKLAETADLHYGASTFLTQNLYEHLKKNFVGFCNYLALLKLHFRSSGEDSQNARFCM
jgi:hypothetical protein